MNRWAIIISLGAALILIGAVLAASNSLSLQEMSLAPVDAGYVYEVNLGEDGYLYVSDYDAKQIWRVNPANQEDVKRYQFAINVADARADAAGNIWFTDGGMTFARSNAAGDQAVSWNVAVGQNLNGTAFSPDGKIWFTDWINSDSHIFSFDTTELCTYTLPLNATDPAGSQSWYILYGQNKLWIANRILGRIYSIDPDPAPGEATYWQIDPTLSSSPYGIAMDDQGKLWWADEALNALVSLNPNTNPDEMLRYNLPNGATPYMLTSTDNVLWFSAVGATHGYLGALVPSKATGTPITIEETGTYSMTRECNPDIAGTEIYVNRTDENPDWINSSAAQTVDTSEWQIYELPTDALPFAVNVHENYLWATDQGRQKLMRVELPTLAMSNIYLPLVVR